MVSLDNVESERFLWIQATHFAEERPSSLSIPNLRRLMEMPLRSATAPFQPAQI